MEKREEALFSRRGMFNQNTGDKNVNILCDKLLYRTENAAYALPAFGGADLVVVKGVQEIQDDHAAAVTGSNKRGEFGGNCRFCLKRRKRPGEICAPE